VDKIEDARAWRSEAPVPTDLLASLLIERSAARPAQRRQPATLPAKVYAAMAVTTLLTFATLTTGYQMLFPHQLFG
jgi:hypothetical protein